MAAADDLYTDKAETMGSGRRVYVVLDIRLAVYSAFSVLDFSATNCPALECGIWHFSSCVFDSTFLALPHHAGARINYCHKEMQTQSAKYMWNVRETERAADNWDCCVSESVITYWSPDTVVIHFQTSFMWTVASNQSHCKRHFRQFVQRQTVGLTQGKAVESRKWQLSEGNHDQRKAQTCNVACQIWSF